MNTARDKAVRVLWWTWFLLCLVFCIQGHPPARGQDGTTTATIGGIATAVALQNKDIAHLDAAEHANELLIAKMEDRNEERDRDFYTFEARINAFVLILMFLGGGNIGVTWYKSKKAA